MAAFSKLSDRLTPQNSAIIAFAAVAAWTAVRYGRRKSGRYCTLYTINKILTMRNEVNFSQR